MSIAPVVACPGSQYYGVRNSCHDINFSEVGVEHVKKIWLLECWSWDFLQERVVPWVVNSY